jgi:hypothetical protein
VHKEEPIFGAIKLTSVLLEDEAGVSWCNVTFESTAKHLLSEHDRLRGALHRLKALCVSAFQNQRLLLPSGKMEA